MSLTDTELLRILQDDPKAFIEAFLCSDDGTKLKLTPEQVGVYERLRGTDKKPAMVIHIREVIQKGYTGDACGGGGSYTLLRWEFVNTCDTCGWTE